MAALGRTWPRILTWALVLGIITTLIADWGEWDRILVNLLWRGLIIAIGGIAGLVLNVFAGNYVTMATNVVESMGIVRFSSDRGRKIENSFIFVLALVAAIVALIVIK